MLASAAPWLPSSLQHPSSFMATAVAGRVGLYPDLRGAWINTVHGLTLPRAALVLTPPHIGSAFLPPNAGSCCSPRGASDKDNLPVLSTLLGEETVHRSYQDGLGSETA